MKWDVCVEQLAAELTAEQLNTWIKPLQVEESAQSIYLFAPNRFVKDWVADRYLDRISHFILSMWRHLPCQFGWARRTVVIARSQARHQPPPGKRTAA